MEKKLHLMALNIIAMGKRVGQLITDASIMKERNAKGDLL
jgi:hypothetical protein